MNKVYEENRIQAIADAIREKTGTDTTYTTAEMPNGIDEVYASGKQDEWSAFWDSYQQNGTRTNYEGAFDGKGWDDNNFKPKYDIINIGDYSCSQSFRQSRITDLKGILEKQKVEYNTKGATRFINTFQACDVTRIPTLYLDSCGLLQNCFTAVTISEMELHNLQSGCTFVNAFTGARSLSTLTLKNCTIGQNGLNLKDCTKLSRASIESVVNALSDTVEGMPTVTLSKTAVENAFSVSPNLILPSWDITQTEHDGLTITDNGDGSFTLNGTYQNEQYHELFFTVDENVTWSEREGTYGLFLEGDTTNSIHIYASGATDELNGQGWTHVLELGNDPLAVRLVIPRGTTFQNVTVRPKLLYDEWQSLIWHKSHFWNITLA